MKRKNKILLSVLLLFAFSFGVYKQHNVLTQLSKTKIVSKAIDKSIKKATLNYEQTEPNPTDISNINQIHLNKESKLQVLNFKDYNNKKVIDWEKQTGAHPNLLTYPVDETYVIVDQKTQRLAVYHNNTKLTQLIISTGIKNSETPSGMYKIERERGDWFYNSKVGIDEGAKNWVSFKDHGIYLFHSIVFNQDKTVKYERQGKLGKRNSHGCIQMSLPDSIWFYNNIREGVHVYLNEV